MQLFRMNSELIKMKINFRNKITIEQLRVSKNFCTSTAQVEVF